MANVTPSGAGVSGPALYIGGTLVAGATSGYLLYTDSNGVLQNVATSSLSLDLDVGSSTITGGTTTRILYDNLGVLGEYTISGNGTAVAMASSPVLTTPALGVATATSLAIGGATLGANALAVTGTSLFNSTVTMPDGAAWASTGLSNSASYTTASTPIITLLPTINYSATGGTNAITIAPTLVATGATGGLSNGAAINTIWGTSSVNVATARSLAVTLTMAAGYSGTLTTGIAILGTVGNSGSNPITTAYSIFANALSNGNGITSGTVTNIGLHAAASTAAAASGGTIINRAGSLAVGTGSGAGTTTNVGLFITGNGGSGGAGTTTNYAIYSDSTAASLLTGGLSTAAPAGSSAGLWKFGALQTAAVVLDTTRSLYVDVGGTVYHVMVST